VAVVEPPQGSDNLPRYRQLDTPLAFAREQLRASGEEVEVQRRHAAAMREHHARARADLMAGRIGFEAWRDQLNLELEGGLAACAWAAAHDTQAALALAAALSRLLASVRHTDGKALWLPVEPLLDAAIAAPAAVPTESLAQAVYECSIFWTQHRPQHARLRAEQALALAQAAGDTLTHYLALAQIAWLCGENEDRAAFDAATAQMRSLINPDWCAYVKVISSQHEWLLPFMAGDNEAALQALRLLLARLDECAYLAVAPHVNLVTVLIRAQRHDEAITMARALLARFARRRSSGPSATLLHCLARACLAQGDTAQARDALQRLWPLAQNDDTAQNWACCAALLAALEQRPRAALLLLGFSDAANEKAAPGGTRDAAGRAMAERAEALACRALDCEAAPDAMRAHKDPGARLSEDDMVALALAWVEA